MKVVKKVHTDMKVEHMKNDFGFVFQKSMFYNKNQFSQNLKFSLFNIWTNYIHQHYSVNRMDEKPIETALLYLSYGWPIILIILVDIQKECFLPRSKNTGRICGHYFHTRCPSIRPKIKTRCNANVGARKTKYALQRTP